MKTLIENDYVEISGIKFKKATVSSTLDDIQAAIHRGGEARHVVTVNTDILLKAQKDEELLAIIKQAWIVTADGMPIVWLSRLLGDPLPERVTGSDLTRRLCQEGSGRGVSLFFLGAAPGVGERARYNAVSDYPGLRIVGTYSPTSEELQDHDQCLRMADMINLSRANVLLVAFGAPKQEKWIYKYKDHLDASVVIGVGASIDFLSGDIPRAPIWMQRSGTEWVYRLSKEPLRLWRRYLNDLRIIFLFVKSLSRIRGGD